jgi:hypothetical protein
MVGVDRLRVLSANEQKMYTGGSSAGPDTARVSLAVHRDVEEHLFHRSNSTRTMGTSESFSSTIAVELDARVLPWAWCMEHILAHGTRPSSPYVSRLGGLVHVWFRDSGNPIFTDDTWFERMPPEDFRALTPLTYAHINPYGTFELDMQQRLHLDAA